MSGPSDDDRPLEPEPTALEQAALQWVVRCDRGLRADEAEQFTAWIEAAPEHRELFEEFGGTWAVMTRWEKPAAATPQAQFGGASVVDEGGPASLRTGRLASRWWAPLATAAALTVAYLGWWRPAYYTASITTEIGAGRQLTLADGSSVELNTDSTLVADFTPGTRRVRLVRGEVHFKIAKDPGRPFIVEAAGVDVRAVGTAFNVRLGSESVEVLVTEGKVRVATAPAPAPADAAATGALEMGRGDRTVIALAAGAPAPRVVQVPADEMGRILAWQGGRLSFSDTTLRDMVAEFNRYNRRKLGIADAELATVRFGGSFRPDDRDGFVRVLRENFGVRIEERGDETILHANR